MRSCFFGLVFVLTAAQPAVAATDFLALGKVSGEWFDAKFSGKTPDGHSFSIDRDGSAEVSASATQADGRGDIYYIRCIADAMTDAKGCFIDWRAPMSIQLKYAGGPSAIAYCVTNTSLMVGRPLFRVDDNPPVEGLPGGCTSDAATKKMNALFKVGSRLRTRTLHLSESPQSRDAVDIDGSITPVFSTAVEMMNFVRSGGKNKIAWPKGR
jgi:hypothetical protein